MSTKWDASGILRGLQKAATSLDTGVKAGVSAWAQNVLTESQKLVPVEEGTLLNSGIAVSSPNGRTAAIGYGGNDSAPYAVKQHEEIGYVHKKGGQAKFLEIPLQASKDAGMKLVARALKKRR